MAERVVKVVDDDDDESTPVIDDIKFLKTVKLESENNDPFAVTGEDIKSLRGTDGVFKRKVATELRKARTSHDGSASSTQIDDNVVTGYDAFGVVSPPYNLDYLAKLYEISSPHKAAVDAKAANIVGLGYKFVETPKTKHVLEDLTGNDKKLKKVTRALDIHKEELGDKFEAFNDEDTFTEILVKAWKDYESTGMGYIEVSRKKDGTIGYLGHIPSKTMRMRRKRDGFVQISGNKAVYFANFGAGVDENGKSKSIPNPISGERPNEVIYIKKYSPTSTYYGVPDIIAAQQAVAGNEFAARFNLDYFENKAVPRHLIILKGARLGTRAEAQLLEFFETKLKGQNHRSLYIPLPGDTDEGKVELKIEAVEAGIQDSSFNNYLKANLRDILMVHRVPVTKVSVSEGASLAVAKDADKTFKEQVCAPEQKVFEKKLNRLVKELTDSFILKLDEMTLTDSNTQSQIDERNVKNGIVVPNEVRTREGLPAIKGGDERVDLNAKDKISQAQAEARAQGNRERDSNRSSGATDSQGNARNPKGDGRSEGTA